MSDLLKSLIQSEVNILDIYDWAFEGIVEEIESCDVCDCHIYGILKDNIRVGIGVVTDEGYNIIEDMEPCDYYCECMQAREKLKQKEEQKPTNWIKEGF